MNRLVIYNIVNKEQSRTLQKDSGGVIEWPVQPEEIDAAVELCIIPYYTDFVELSRSEVDGRYQFALALKPYENAEQGGSSEYSNCMVEIDPETSLIVAYAYDMKMHQNGGTIQDSNGNTYNLAEGDIEQSVTGEVFYNVEGPDYSMLSA